MGERHHAATPPQPRRPGLRGPRRGRGAGARGDANRGAGCGCATDAMPQRRGQPGAQAPHSQASPGGDLACRIGTVERGAEGKFCLAVDGDLGRRQPLLRDQGGGARARPRAGRRRGPQHRRGLYAGQSAAPPDAFQSLDQAFEPAANAAYAAAFLAELHRETRSWSRAVAFYHSRTRAFYQPYRNKVYKLWRVVRWRAAEAHRAEVIAAYLERRARREAKAAERRRDDGD